MKKIMSHNSWTFLKPIGFFAKIFNFTAKCQDKNIQEQYEKYGVRMFDLRIRLNKNNKPVIAHGLFEYDATNLTSDLNYLNTKRDVTIRVLLELRDGGDSQKEWFIKYCSQLWINYPNINFCGGYATCNNSKIYFKFTNPHPSCFGAHASCITKNKLDDLWPKFFAFRNNWYYRKLDIEQEYLSLDFVNL